MLIVLPLALKTLDILKSTIGFSGRLPGYYKHLNDISSESSIF